MSYEMKGGTAGGGCTAMVAFPQAGEMVDGLSGGIGFPNGKVK